MAVNKVQYLHFRYLKLLMKAWKISLITFLGKQFGRTFWFSCFQPDTLKIDFLAISYPGIRMYTGIIMSHDSKKIQTYPWNIPENLNHLFMKGNSFMFVFWGSCGMFQGSVGIFLDSSFVSEQTSNLSLKNCDLVCLFVGILPVNQIPQSWWNIKKKLPKPKI